MIKLFEELKASTKSLRIVRALHNKTDNLKVRKVIDILFILCGLLKLAIRKKKQFKPELLEKIAIVGIVKNEGPYLKEWIEYHKLLGVSKFYIYDNASTDNTADILKEFIEDGSLRYQYVSGVAHQMDVYNAALEIARKNEEYLLFLDADEFVFLQNNSANLLESVQKIFRKDSHIGGIAINWLVFGSANHKEKPKGLVTQNYFFRSKEDFEFNVHVKTICDPRKVAGVLNPHYPEYLFRYYAVDQRFNKVFGAFNRGGINQDIRINHYFTKSREEFILKRNRGMADSNRVRDPKEFEIHDKNDVYDDSMKRYKKDLERRCDFEG